MERNKSLEQPPVVSASEEPETKMAVLRQAEESEEGRLVGETADMVEGNRRLNKATSPYDRGSGLSEGREREEEAIEELKKEISTEAARLAAASAQLAEHEIKNGAMADMHEKLNQAMMELAQKRLLLEKRKNDLEALRTKHREMADEQTRITGRDISFAAESMAAAREMTGEAKPDVKDLSQKTEIELARREDERQRAEWKKEDEASFARYEGILASVRARFEEVRAAQKLELERWQEELKSPELSQNVALLKEKVHENLEGSFWSTFRRASGRSEEVRKSLEELEKLRNGFRSRGVEMYNKAIDFLHQATSDHYNQQQENLSAIHLPLIRSTWHDKDIKEQVDKMQEQVDALKQSIDEWRMSYRPFYNDPQELDSAIISSKELSELQAKMREMT